MSSTPETAYNGTESRQLARRDDPESSHRAAKRVTASGRRKNQLMVVHLAVLEHPGLTSRQLADTIQTHPDFFGHDRYTTARRLPELKRIGLVYSVQEKGSDLKWFPGKEPSKQEKLF